MSFREMGLFILPTTWRPTLLYALYGEKKPTSRKSVLIISTSMHVWVVCLVVGFIKSSGMRPAEHENFILSVNLTFREIPFFFCISNKIFLIE